MNNLDYKPELEYDIWQPSEIKGRPDLNVTIRLVPITERAEQRDEQRARARIEPSIRMPFLGCSTVLANKFQTFQASFTACMILRPDTARD